MRKSSSDKIIELLDDFLDGFLDIFSKEYDRLYEEDEDYLNMDEQDALVEKFDKLITKDKAFKLLVNIFSLFRMDFISSDREAVAFMLALKKYKW